MVAAAGNTGFDYLALLCALRAVGATPRPSLVLLAYTAADLLALLPFTPGGLGFVEAGLVGTLALAGVPGPHAVAATLLVDALPGVGRLTAMTLLAEIGDISGSRLPASCAPGRG